MKNKDIKYLNAEIRKFEPLFFFEWLSITAIHPKNQKYLMRIELIMLAFFSIKETEFTKEKKTRKEFEQFLDFYKLEYSELFNFNEDFTPFSQNKLIPLFLNHDKYYFFYGLIENPYTRIKVLSNILNDIEENQSTTIDNLRNHFYLSLNIQTNILSNFDINIDCNNKKETIYIPTDSYFRKFIDLIRVNELNEEALTLGCLNKRKNKVFDMYFNLEILDLITLPFVRINQNSYIILPHLHTELFGRCLKSIINSAANSKDIWNNVHLDFKRRLTNICTHFFSIYPLIYVIYPNRNSEENLLEKYNIASCFLIDENKLIIFKTVRHKENKEFDNCNIPIIEANNDVRNFNEELFKNKEVGIGQYSERIVYGKKSKELEILNVLVSETFSLDLYIPESIDKNNHYVEIGDLSFLFESFLKYRDKAPMHFVKFIQNDNELMNNSNFLLTTNYLDRISLYLKGDNFYFKHGKSPDMLYLASYMGNDYESDYYHLKFKDDIYEVVENKFPQAFDVIEHIEKRHYRAVDLSQIGILYIINILNYPIIIYPPKHISSLSKEEKSLVFMMLPQLFCHYIDKLSIEFVDLLEKSNIFPNEYSILITSNNALTKKENALPYLDEFSKEIENKSFIFKTKRLKNGAIRTFIIANTEKIEVLIELFKPENNSAEKYCLKELIKSIFDFNHDRDPALNANSFVEKNVPDGKKSFSYNALYLENPKLDKYTTPIKINSSDIANANKLFAEYLYSKKIKPGTYTGEEAKNINGDIFDFLQHLLEDSIRKYRKSILYFALQQLELSEGKAALNKIRYGMSSNRDIHYDITELVKTETHDLNLLSAYSKHIIHSILKINPNGLKQINETDWTSLLGIVAALIETSQIYEYINYDLSPHELTITDLYEISSRKISDKIDHLKYEDEFIKQQIISSKKSYKNATKDYDEEIKEDSESINDNPLIQQIDSIDSVFIKEFGYSLTNKLGVLYALFRSKFEFDFAFPISIVTIDEIVEYISQISPDLSESEIKLIIESLSLSYNTYNNQDRMIPTELLRSRNRLNVCPIIKVRDDEYLFGNQMCHYSYKLWWSEIYDGDFPYQLDNKIVNLILDKIHKINSKELEIETANTLKLLLGDEFVILNLKKFNTISIHLPKDPPCGEIDVLCLNKNNKTIFVFEAKSILQKNRPYSINQVFNDFFGDRGKKYNQKLDKKYNFVNNNLETFIRHFNLEYDEHWKVKKAFVVDKRIFAAFHTEYNVEFLFVSELEEFVNN